MKIAYSFMLFFVVSCASGKEKIYTGSTPAGVIVRSFLRIPPSDSIDFIRWKIILKDSVYQLHCHYGVGKPNTEGFMNGGKEIKLTGKLKKEKNYYYLLANQRSLTFLMLNENLLHLLNEDKSLCVGTAGWGYTLNSEKQINTEQIDAIQNPDILKDSVTFHGRTPCNELSAVAGLHVTSNCQRLKWSITLYVDSKNGKPTTFLIRGTAFEQHGSKTGVWNIITRRDGKRLYRLDLGGKDGSLYFFRPDENIFLFTDSSGKLLVGDRNFSYTLSKKGVS